MFFKIFKPFCVGTIKRAKQSKELYEEIGEQRVRIRKLLEEIREEEVWRKEYSGALGNLTEAMQAGVWKKDAEHKYILANAVHCNLFFGYKDMRNCLSAILQRTDTELIDEQFRQQNIQNTFGELCMASDTHAATVKTPTHYIEAGIVAGVEVLLYCVKIPQFIKGEFQGTLGIGWDFSDQSKFVMQLLNRWIYDKKATELYRADKTFSYHIEPEQHQCKVFHHLCPYPQHRKDTLEDLINDSFPT